MIYLDTSLLVTLLAGEPRSLSLLPWAARQGGGQLWISQWTRTEAAGALAARVRGGHLRPQRLPQALLDLGTGPWLMVEIEPMDHDLAAAWAGDIGLVLRGGDALHLAIARRTGFPMATLDNGMASAARKLGLPLVDLPG